MGIVSDGKKMNPIGVVQHARVMEREMQGNEVTISHGVMQYLIDRGCTLIVIDGSSDQARKGRGRTW
jgi:hypothetical protein